ncbi:hypothetical protein HYFRA_00004136 [Hymenoscyphus fraxineus]|uniref:Zn(2)-C6 fungal-type domain-containing protein n=1 Tax=Hymenoscyphus fraxineus TaxID=746836 RepID=A0A9N9KQL8_9HELO|nr:hypothetical protein HYFRA_00004136 [Hymenoscyphus fraxineus]
MVESEVRRRRAVTLSCSLCRRRKIRCNRERPCSNCIRSRSGSCIYDNQNPNPNPLLPNLPRPQRSSNPSHRTQDEVSETANSDQVSATSRRSLPSLGATSSATTPSSSSHQPSSGEIDALKLKIQYLEDKLSESNLVSTPSQASTSNTNLTEVAKSRLGGTYYVHYDNALPGQPQSVARSLTHKTRLLGQSHWEVNGICLIRDIFEAIESAPREAWSGMEKCKLLAREIKLRRAPPWPIIPTSNLPSRDVCDKLIECYIQTTESITRILHIPTFKREYEALWVSESPSDIAFLTQLKLVLALGAVTYDANFSLRVSALHWVYEAQVWASDPFKLRVDIPSLQSDILLLLAQERLGISGHLDWISMGSLLRKAMYMGLHREPDRVLHSRTTYVSEMRRRLWNTILEINLQASLTSGGAPLIALGDFDTAPPGNFNDDQIMIEHVVPESPDTFTQMSIALALRTTFPQRLAVVEFLNGLTTNNSYDETLRLDTDLRTAYKDLYHHLRSLSNNLSPSSFELSAVDLLLHRYISALHIPFFGPSLTSSTYAFSRRIVLESSQKIWQAAHPPPSTSQPSPTTNNALPRLVTHSSGFYPTVTIHATFLISIELRTQLQEDTSLSPISLRPDLLSIIEESKRWALQVLESGEVNIKGYLLLHLVAAQIEALKRGQNKEEIAKALIETVENVVATCLPMLKEMLDVAPAQSAHLVDAGGSGQVPFSLDDWSFTQGDAEPMAWMFDGYDATFHQELSF